MSRAVAELLQVLELEKLEENLFRGRSPQDRWQRVFGGQVIGQALVAACRTVEGRQPHSLHAYFLLGGDPKIPIIYEVDRIRDGRSFTTRRVVAIQHGRAIFNLSASFHIDEPGPDHQVPMPDVPPPEEVPTIQERLKAHAKKLGDWLERPRPIDMRYIGDHILGSREPREPTQQVWMRADGELPDDPMLHACVVAYASDMSLLDSALFPHGVQWDDARFMGASLDHAMWFHRPFRADEWLLYDQDSPTASAARGLGRGQIFSRDGRLVVSVIQEGLMRIRDFS